MNHSAGSESNHSQGRQPEGNRNQRQSSRPATGGITALAMTRWGLPAATSRNTAADAIAEDPAKLCLAGRLISWATAGNDVRFEKVAALRQAIEAGTYHVSSADLADKLIEGLRG